MASSLDVRFLLDEHVPHAVLHGLRSNGIDATSINELRLKGTGDPDVLAVASQQNRVVVTLDTDYLAFPLQHGSHAGIVFIRDGMSIRDVLQVLELIHGATSMVDMRDRIEHASSLA